MPICPARARPPAVVGDEQPPQKGRWSAGAGTGAGARASRPTEQTEAGNGLRVPGDVSIGSRWSRG